MEPVVGSSFVLPSVDSNVAPNEGYAGFSVSYSSSSGVLSFPEVSGANFYMIGFSVSSTDESLGRIISSSSSPTLPDPVRAFLSGATCDVTIVAGSAIGSLDIEEVVSIATYQMDMYPNLKVDYVLAKGGTDTEDGYTQLAVTF